MSQSNQMPRFWLFLIGLKIFTCTAVMWPPALTKYEAVKASITAENSESFTFWIVLTSTFFTSVYQQIILWASGLRNQHSLATWKPETLDPDPGCWTPSKSLRVETELPQLALKKVPCLAGARRQPRPEATARRGQTKPEKDKVKLKVI